MQKPKELVARVKNMKEGFTVRRAKCTLKDETSMKEKREKKRKQRVKHLTDIANCLTSEMNTCQAVVRPDCSKWSVSKAMGMKKAIVSVLVTCLEGDGHDRTAEEAGKWETEFKRQGLALFGSQRISVDWMQNVTLAVFEFAGVKFKTVVHSGRDYLEFVERNIINKTLQQLPQVDHIVICEEKYAFTPDLFKADTRSKRKTSAKASISHLKRGSDVISEDIFDKNAACFTSGGKILTSTFLGAHASKLHVQRPITLDIDSEWIMETCKHQQQGACPCPPPFAIPVRVFFKEENVKEISRLSSIHQRKGEAEMAVIDWLIERLPSLKEGDAVASVMTSGDIDAIPIHLFALTLLWPRNSVGTFSHPVYVLLQKPKGNCDIYNMTKIIETIERKFGKGAALKIAVGMCIGGNDFMLKFSGISHEKVLRTFIRPPFLDDLIQFADVTTLRGGTINKTLFVEFIKEIYCPLKYEASKLTFNEVRHLTFKCPGKATMRKPRQWMPPESALLQIASLIDLQIEYLYGAGNHQIELPNFLARECLQQDDEGRVIYYLGPDANIDTPEQLLTIPDGQMKQVVAGAKKTRHISSESSKQQLKRTLEDTPQKGKRRKRKPQTSTPRKKNVDAPVDASVDPSIPHM